LWHSLQCDLEDNELKAHVSHIYGSHPITKTFIPWGFQTPMVMKLTISPFLVMDDNHNKMIEKEDRNDKSRNNEEQLDQKGTTQTSKG
jgi:hypothetical protein